MKKAITLLFAILALSILTVGLLSLDASAATTSGTTGDCAWTLDDEGVLIISGTGKMEDYSTTTFFTDAPWGTDVTEVIIEEGVTSIGEAAFYGCGKLTSVTIGNSVASIGKWAFYCCESLHSIYISDLKAWCEIDFLNYYGANPLYYAKELFLNGEMLAGALVIPNGTTRIGRYAFYRYPAITSITIPDSVTSIDIYAFYDCDKLTSVTIGNGVTSIGNYAFENCSSLETITIGKSLASVGEWAFFGCDNLKDVWYGGTKADYEKINLQSYNYNLSDATWHGADGETFSEKEDGPTLLGMVVFLLVVAPVFFFVILLVLYCVIFLIVRIIKGAKTKLNKQG